MNTVNLIGRLTKDPELKYTNNGKGNTRFTLAVQRNKEETDFINCVAWEKLQKILLNTLKKVVK
jgi:single-strand DNA-binding protein